MAKVLIGNVKPVKGVDYLTEEDIQGLGEYFAPAGYVDGEYTTNAVGELEGILKGIYTTMKNKSVRIINVHLNVNDGLDGGNWFITMSKRTNDYGFVEAAMYTSTGVAPTICRKNIYDGVWSAWSYENPNMAIGVEYLTTEVRNGKPVYTTLVLAGSMPNATTKSIDHNLEVDIPLRCSGVYDSVCTIPCKHNEIETSVSFGKTQIFIYSATDLSAYHAYIQLWYTKE